MADLTVTLTLQPAVHFSRLTILQGAAEDVWQLERTDRIGEEHHVSRDVRRSASGRSREPHRRGERSFLLRLRGRHKLGPGGMNLPLSTITASCSGSLATAPDHVVVAGRLGLRVDDGGHPDGAADPRRRLEVGASEPRPAGVPRRRADRRAGQPHAVQEVGDWPAGDRLQPGQPGAPVDLQASRAPAVPRVPRHQRVAAQGSFRAVLRPAGALLPPCKPILPAKGDNDLLSSVYHLVFFSDILLYLHWQSIILEHIVLLLAFMITMFKMLVIASIMNKNISSSVLCFKM